MPSSSPAARVRDSPVMRRWNVNGKVLAAFVLLVLLVGTNLVAIRYSNRELAPFWNAGFRFLLAAIGFAIILVARRPGRPSRRAIAGGTLYGLLAFAGFFGFIYLALVHAPAAIAQTVLALNPLVTMFLAAAIGMERLRWQAFLGAAISLLGIAIAFGAAAQLRVPADSLLELVAATTSFAAGAIVVRRQRGAEPITQNLLATAVGGAILLSISAAVGEPWQLPATPGTWAAFLYLVGPGTIVVFLLLLYVLREWSATASSYQFVLAPIVSVILAATLLGEAVGPTVLVGVAFVLVGVYIGAVRRGS
jgi:drug/metabolite transporter (DMT)-like permease